MTLRELSLVYRERADALRERIRTLQATPVPPEEWPQMEARIRMLETMWREARELAVLTERYYERGYRRNGKYTL